MVASDLALNPYQAIALPAPVSSVPFNPQAPLEVTDVKRRLLYRRISLSGCIETSIAWDARGAIEHVQVGGRRVVARSALWYVPRFEFAIPTCVGPLYASIDVDVAWMLVTRGFRLTIAQAVVYSEGTLLTPPSG